MTDRNPNYGLGADTSRLGTLALAMAFPTHIAGAGIASDYAIQLLEALGIASERVPGEADPAPVIAWARSGAMALTGHANEAPRCVDAPVASCAEGALKALRALAPGAALPSDGAALLGERAAIAGLSRSGTTSPGGACRLLPTADGWVAVHLAREEDRAALPAFLERPVTTDPWHALTKTLPEKPSREWVQRATWLALPVAASGEASGRSWLQRTLFEHRRPTSTSPRVLDLSHLWAGPLCTSLLHSLGANVVKLESRARPDGARLGPTQFFNLLNAGKASVALPLTTDHGRDALLKWIAAADIVVESTRPRALQQLGIDSESVLAAQPGKVWVRLTGYGDAGNTQLGRVAFGDDAAVAGGLAEAVGGPSEPLFCGDAIADPLTGLHAALAAFAQWRSGQGARLDIALRDVAATVRAFSPGNRAAMLQAEVIETASGFAVRTDDAIEDVARPRARTPDHTAAALGASIQATAHAFRRAC